MHLFWDLDQDELVTGPKGARQVSATIKSRSKVPIVLTFLRSGVPVAVPSGTVLRFGVKVAAGTLLLALSDPLTESSGSLVGVLNTNTNPMNTAMGRTWARSMVGELTGALLDNDPVSPQTVKLLVEAKVLIDGDDAPVDLPAAEDWLDARAVRHDITQTLSDAAQLRALANLGITFPGGDLMQITRNGRALTVFLTSTD